jgi:hypothetical protein
VGSALFPELGEIPLTSIAESLRRIVKFESFSYLSQVCTSSAEVGVVMGEANFAKQDTYVEPPGISPRAMIR